MDDASLPFRMCASTITRGELSRAQSVASSHLSAEEAAEKERQQLRAALERVGIESEDIEKQFEDFVNTSVEDASTPIVMTSPPESFKKADTTDSEQILSGLLSIGGTLKLMVDAGLQRRADDAALAKASTSSKMDAIQKKATLQRIFEDETLWQGEGHNVEAS